MHQDQTPPLRRGLRQRRTAEELREAVRVHERRRRDEQMVLRRHRRALEYGRTHTYEEIYLAVTSTIVGFLNRRPNEDTGLAAAGDYVRFLFGKKHFSVIHNISSLTSRQIYFRNGRCAHGGARGVNSSGVGA